MDKMPDSSCINPPDGFTAPPPGGNVADGNLFCTVWLKINVPAGTLANIGFSLTYQVAQNNMFCGCKGKWISGNLFVPGRDASLLQQAQAACHAQSE